MLGGPEGDRWGCDQYKKTWDAGVGWVPKLMLYVSGAGRCTHLCWRACSHTHACSRHMQTWGVAGSPPPQPHAYVLS